MANAVEASAPGGKVELEVIREESNEAVRVEVRDHGRGMSPEVLAKVGTPFFTTREEGTGLGVALARAAFVQHGGKLEYLSEPGRGTVARGTLPVRAPVAAAALPESPESPRRPDEAGVGGR
ncbi:MAG: sensor histidine kinase [Myxococcales bacterium]